MAETKPTEKRPRGRPATGRPPKRNMTIRLASDVAEYLDTVQNKAEAVEDAIRSTKEFKSKERGNCKDE